MLCRSAALATALIASSAIAASAQTGGPRTDATNPAGYGVHDAAVGIAFGGIFSMDPDLDVQPSQFVVSARRGISARAVVEPEVGRWWYTRTTPTFRDSVRWTFAGVTLLGRIPRRTASFFAGGGAGIYHYSSARIVTLPGHVSSSVSDHTTTGAQGMVGLDLRLAGNLAALGMLRLQLVPEADLATMGLYAGVRYAF